MFIEELSPSKFLFENCGQELKEDQPWRFENKHVIIKSGWKMVGWCDSSYIEYGKKENLFAILFSTPENEECWFHASENIISLLGIEKGSNS